MYTFTHIMSYSMRIRQVSCQTDAFMVFGQGLDGKAQARLRPSTAAGKRREDYTIA